MEQTDGLIDDWISRKKLEPKKELIKVFCDIETGDEMFDDTFS